MVVVKTGLESSNLSLGSKLAHVKGASYPDLEEITIPDFFARTVSRYPNREACVFKKSGECWTWLELARKIDQLSAGLLALGIYKGERVGILSPNRPEWVLTQFATARIGAILVNINPAYQRAELEYALVKVGVKALITAESFKSSGYLKMLVDLAPELSKSRPGRLAAAKFPLLKSVIQTGDAHVQGMFRFVDVMAKGGSGQQARLDAIGRKLFVDEPINLQFTSGTTGSPKAATLTHRNVVNNSRYVAKCMNLSQKDRLCIPVPLYHCFGMVLGNLTCVAAGSTMVFPGEGFDALQTLETLDKERCTAVHGVPTMFSAMVNCPEFSQFDLQKLRTGIMAGAPCPIELMTQVVSKMNLRQMTIAYGMTETSPVSFQSAVNDPIERRVSTVGRIQPHVEARVVDTSGEIVAVGEQGELHTRGYHVMRGYWDDPERTAVSIDAEGWMHTGDLASIDAEGYCNIVGRVKDMLIRGGENVYPREIEEFLLGHPEVQDVQIFGVPDEKYGEEICAWIVPVSGTQLSLENIRNYCEGQIAHYKIPRYAKMVPEFPMTVTGKPQKYVMREKMIEELKLTEMATA
jgi:fatty-acyl-CoA synthase|tara:strand:- start:6 stop:1739 length:1734 start_codon:yes stop_codon:yes gene_type:complete